VAARSEQDAAAFSEFVAARSGSLFRTAYLVAGEHQLAQDLLQESLVKLYVAWPRLRDMGKAEAYTRRIIVTTAISWSRRRSSRERPTAVLPETPTPDPAAAVAAQDELWTYLHALPPRQRAAVALRHCQDLSEAQTAELMGCSVGTVKRQTSLGLARLRASLGPALAGPSKTGRG
jgi:RNA polymerase sigma-70 factor (sigma-E family)